MSTEVKVIHNVYPASIPADMKEFFNPSLILTAIVQFGKSDKYWCNDKVLSITDQFNHIVYENKGDLHVDTQELVSLYNYLGWNDAFYVYSLFHGSDSYSLLAQARQ